MRTSIAPIHHAWIIAGVASLTVFAAVGLARFAFGMILPAMARDLALSYSQQGILGASYFLGYLAVMVMLPWLAPRFGPRRLCSAGLLLVAVGLIGLSQSRDYVFLCFSYGVTGIGSGAAFVPALALTAHWFHPSHRGRGAGIIVAGAGFGIVVSGFLVPRLVPVAGLVDWQLGWLIFAVVVLGVALLAGVVLRDRPGDLDLEPAGQTPVVVNEAQPEMDAAAKDWPVVLHLGVIYALFAATALTYTTFIVTTMVQDFTLTAASAGALWAWVGFFSIFSGAAFGLISDRLGRRLGMIIALGVQLAAFVLVAFDSGMIGLYGSAALFGISAWSMPSIVAAASGDYLGPEKGGRICPVDLAFRGRAGIGACWCWSARRNDRRFWRRLWHCGGLELARHYSLFVFAAATDP